MIKITAANSTYTQGWVSLFADTFVQAESSVLRTSIRAKKTALHISVNRWKLS